MPSHMHTHTQTFFPVLASTVLQQKREKTDFDPLLFSIVPHSGCGGKKRAVHLCVKDKPSFCHPSDQLPLKCPLWRGQKAAGETEYSISLSHAGYLLKCDFQQTINNVRGGPLGSAAIVASVEVICVCAQRTMGTNNFNI